jgi:hypothetical protein
MIEQPKEYNSLEHSVVQGLKGDATHRYEVPEYVEALIRHLKRELDTVYWNWEQQRLDDRYDWQLIFSGFEYRRYYWGDCDCGADSAVHATECRMLSEHEEWNRRRIEAISDPSQWDLMSEEAREAKIQEIKDKSQRDGGDIGFALMMLFVEHGSSNIHFDRSEQWEKDNPHPPCSCGAENEWKPRDYHLASCSPGLPNIKFGSVTVNWYKHIGRGMSTNAALSPAEWVEWFNEAIKVIGLYNHCMQGSHQQFRDEDAGIEPFSSDDKVQCSACKYCVTFGANALRVTKL